MAPEPLSTPAETGSRRSDRLLSRCSRITTSGDFIREIDGVRFFAIAFVVVAHAGTWATIVYGWGIDPDAPPLTQVATTGAVHAFQTLFGLGWWGVPLFFVVSGFVLAQPFAKQRMLDGRRVSLGHYYLRRLTRLEPPYLIALFGTFALMAALPYPPAPVPKLASGLTWGVPYLANFRGGNAVLGVAWSLEIEVQFYVLMPLLGLVFSVRPTLARRALIFGAILFAIVAQRWWLPASTPQTLLQWIQFFLAGFLLADVYLVEWKGASPRRRSWGWDLAFVACVCLMVAVQYRYGRTIAVPVLRPLVCLSLCVAAFKGRALSSVARNRWIFTIGGMCYSLYLVHIAVIFVLVKATAGPAHRAGWTWGLPGGYLPNMAAVLVLFLGAVLAAGTAYFVWVERPFMDRELPGRLANFSARSWRRLTGRRPAPADQ